MPSVILAAMLAAGAARPCAAQMFPMGGPRGQPQGQMPPEIREMQKAQAKLMEELDPELSEFQEKQRGIEERIREVEERFAKNEIDKDAAKEELLPLMTERQELMNDPDFLAEQELARVVFSSPRFRAKMEKIMRQYAPKPPATSKASSPDKAGR